MKIDLAAWVKNARVHGGKTQDDLAIALDTTKANISSMENSRSKPSFEIMLKISKLTGFPLPHQEDTSTKIRASGLNG